MTPTDYPRKVAIILNPVAGLKGEAKPLIQDYLSRLPECQVTYYETKGSGDAMRFAKEAAEKGAEMVLAYGGDGTITEAADGLRGTDVPLGILPGGTANVMSIELGVPTDLVGALDLIFARPNQPRRIDMGRIDQQMFLLRAGIGYEAELSSTAPREAKRERGRLAYFQHALSLVKKLRQARYRITVDGKQHVAHGITCMICNSTNVGLPKLKLIENASVSDGMLDVVVIEGLGIGSLLRVFTSIFQKLIPGRRTAPPPLKHWQGRDITVQISPRQLVAFDGEKLKKAKRVTATVLPGVLTVIVPMEAAAVADEVAKAAVA